MIFKRAAECLDKEAWFESIKEQTSKIEQLFRKIADEVVAACLRGERSQPSSTLFVSETISSINLVLDAVKSEESLHTRASTSLYGLLYLAKPLLKSQIESQRLLGAALLNNFWSKQIDSKKNAV